MLTKFTFCFASRIDLVSAPFWNLHGKEKKKGRGKVKHKDVKKHLQMQKKQAVDHADSPWILSRLESRDVLAVSCVTIVSRNGRHCWYLSIFWALALALALVLA